MVAESWFRALWKSSRKHEVGSKKVCIGVLAFEVATLMSKLIQLWHSLCDKQVVKTREEIMNSVGIKNLVSDNDDYIASLICEEMIKNVDHVARAVARLAKKCSDPYLKSFEKTFDDLISIGADPYEWQYTWKKMDRKVKKMERFIMVNANLHQEVETLAELEQMVRRMKYTDDQDDVNLIRNEKKVIWKQHEVKNLKEISLWNKTYDYVVHLLARSLFTILGRIGHLFGFNHVIDMDINDSNSPDSNNIYRSQSVSAVLQSSAHPSENRIPRYSSGPLEKITTTSGPLSRKRTSNFYSGLLGNSNATSSPTSRRNKTANFFSAPIGKSTTKSGPLRESKGGLKLWKTRGNSSTLQGKSSNVKSNKLTTVGPFKGCVINGDTSPVKNFFLSSNGIYSGTVAGVKEAGVKTHAYHNLLQSDQSIFRSKVKHSNASPGTLGAAALALHYANVIILIEKLVASPHLIGHDARHDLYNMLPVSIRTALRVKLKPCAKSIAMSAHDAVLAEEWNEAILGIMEWLAPLAHNTIRWQSERSFEHQNLLSKTSVLLVQTLYYANQEKTEAAITDLLVGLNYIWRYGRELNSKDSMECESGRTFDDSLTLGYQQ